MVRELEELQKEVKEGGKKASREAKEAVLFEARRKSKEAEPSPGLLKARKKIVKDLLSEEEKAETDFQDEVEIQRLQKVLDDIYKKEEKASN